MNFMEMYIYFIIFFLYRRIKMKIFQILLLQVIKIVKSIFYYLVSEDNIQENKTNNEKTLDLSNNPIVFDEENLNNTSINTNDFSFYKLNEKKVEMNEFDKNILSGYVNKEKKYMEINYYQNKKFLLKDFQQLKFELNSIETNIENYFEIPFMKNNIKYKKMNKYFENKNEDLCIKTSKKEKNYKLVKIKNIL